ncbi:recombinase family protein [Geomonas paludis]|uniref:Recombinase family protein n=1 Tax=Geomonas paludis TaxID=2740185 RepID=A0A6V8N061_9BACT|nr:recombinase family protein [Geomonas paludis]UPU36617.1 recombinase family protein [Geomonas paludis]GFO65878.1 resolvase [Geomonas paludis]
MKGQRVGYIRVSSEEQNINRQLEGLNLDKTFTDRLSGKDMNRPELKRMLEFVREGDLVIIHSMDRLARNLDNLRKMVKDLTDRGIKVQFIKENLIFSGEDSPMSNLLLSLLGAVAEFERALIRERQMEGIAEAKKKGVYGGRKRVLQPEQVEDLKRRTAAGEKRAALAREMGISRETLYQYLRV